MNMTETKLSPAEEDSYFPHDPEVTDFTFIVDNRKFHVAKVVLIDASPVFRRMFKGDFKEKNITELELPGKDGTIFEFFLRCIYPRECTLTEESVFQVLPLADEYDVKCIQQKCEEWLLTELELKYAKVSPHYINVKNSIEYLTKWMYYAEKYRLDKLYATALDKLLPFRLRSYIDSENYKMMPETMKREILEKRLCLLEGSVQSINDYNYQIPKAWFQ
uniref:BTB and MATH domain-containing protein 47-like n=1 Tax=Crassostrea virginica TaxID=6565 RepID=A0A8B8BEV4_CRAVI|nr:BTB and MATH domain-containing protein 47-like [Crassostrea virginica]